MTADDVRAFQEDVRLHGLPGWLDGDLRALGASASFRNQIKGSILNIDPVAAASASIPDLLDNAAFDAAMQSAVQALQSFAG